jgi:drug/metabolite transporter (DMT)-like permease
MQVSPRSWLVFLFLSLVWGSSFILIKKGLVSFSAGEVAALRISISTIAFIPLYFLLYHRPVPRNKLIYIALVGVLGNGAPAFLYALAQTHISSSVAGILNSLTPIFTWMLGLWFFATVYARSQVVGVLLGLLGALMIIVLDSDLNLTFNEYALLILVATVCYGFAGNIVKTHLQDVHPVTLSAFAFFSIGAFALGYLFSTDVAHAVVASADARLSLLAVAVLALGGTVLANILFFRLIQDTSALFSSAVAYCIPLTALFWGILDGEVLQWTHLTGMVLILTGIFVLRRS